DRLRLDAAQSRPRRRRLHPHGRRAGGADPAAARRRPRGTAARRQVMSRAAAFIFRRRGGRGWHWTDIVTWVWLIGGLVLMFGPALWLVASSFKTPAALAEFPPALLPYSTVEVPVAGYDKPLPL